MFGQSLQAGPAAGGGFQCPPGGKDPPERLAVAVDRDSNSAAAIADWCSVWTKPLTGLVSTPRARALRLFAMSWASTGANAIPLGVRGGSTRRAQVYVADDTGLLKVSFPQSDASSDAARKRTRNLPDIWKFLLFLAPSQGLVST